MQPLEWREVALRDGVRNTTLRWIAGGVRLSLGIPAPVGSRWKTHDAAGVHRIANNADQA